MLICSSDANSICHLVPSEQKAEGDKPVCLSIPGLALDLGPGPGPGPVDAAIALAPAAVATAGKSSQLYEILTGNSCSGGLRLHCDEDT